jgi:hypothetical protein
MNPMMPNSVAEFNEMADLNGVVAMRLLVSAMEKLTADRCTECAHAEAMHFLDVIAEQMHEMEHQYQHDHERQK